MGYIPNLITFLIYFVFIFIIAIYTKRQTRTLSGFVLSDRGLSGPVAALGVGASDMSGWLLLGLPGAIFAHGLNQIWIPISLIIGGYLNWLLVAKRLREASEKAQDAQTIPEYFERRFNDKSGALRVITALVILLFFTFYASSGFVGGALLFQNTFHVSYQPSLWIFAVLITAYTMIGGFLAVNRIDFFQGCLMFVAILTIPIYLLFHWGSVAPIHHDLAHVAQPFFAHPFSNISVIGLISLLAWGLGYFGQPHILVRFMAAKSPDVLPMARRICTSWTALALIGAVAIGFLGAVEYHHSLKDPESVFLDLSQALFNPWVAGILLSAVLSAIMSTIAAQLLAASTSLISDIYQRFFNKKASDRQLLILSRLSIAAITLIAVLLAMHPSQTIMALVSFAWGGLGAAFGPVIIMSLFWKKMTRNAALSGMIAGAVVVIAWKCLSPLGGIFALYEILPGFIANIAVSVLVGVLQTRSLPRAQKKAIREVANENTTIRQ